MKRPYEIIILESRRVNILKKDYWTISECSFEICGHEFHVKTDQLGCEYFSNLLQCHDQSCLLERKLGTTMWGSWQSEYDGERVRQVC